MMLMLLCVVSTWAEVTDLPEMSTGDAIKWYTIKNVRKGKFATYAGDAATMTQQANASAASFFYFTASTTEGAVKIHNYAAGEKLCAAYNSWTEAGIDWYLKAQSTGVSICTSNGEWNAWNDASGNGQYVEYWSASDAGSAWAIELVTDFTSIINVPAAKEAAIAELDALAYPPTIAEAEAEINAVTPASTSLDDLNAAIEAINTIVLKYRRAAYETLSGKYYTINTPVRDNGYLQMAASNVVGTATANTPANIWQFVENNGKVNIYNPYTGKYLCEPQGNSAEVAVTTDQAAAGAYDLVISSSDSESDGAIVKLTSNAKSAHLDSGAKLVRWDNGGGSEFNVTLVDDFSSIIDAYKVATIATLDQWATLSVVFDAALIGGAKTAIDGIKTTDYATFAAIDAEIVKVTDAVAAKMFTFQTLATDSGRENVWVSASPSTGKAIGAHIAEADYNSIWSLRHAGGVSFYMFNELNQKYMGNPGGNCALSDTPSAAYTFEIIDAETGVVEMKCGGETMHASNHTDDKLLNWDGDEAASRWYIRTINIAAEIEAILNGLTEADYAEVPALGQYTKAGYDALVAARTSAKTVAEVEAAIAAFNKAKNVPVYFITSAWDGGYSAGSAILYNGSAWRWAAADKYNKQMWMTIPAYAQANVPTVNAYDAEGTSYEICDYLTGTVMRGKSVQIVAVDGWEGAYSLQYNANANSTDAAQHAQDGGALVSWKPALADNCQASAWRIEYLGASYDLDQLTDDKMAALSALKSAYDAKAFYADAEMGNGLGQYTGDKDAIVAVLNSAATILNGTLAQQATATVETIDAAKTALNSAAALVINMPAPGKYYRIKGACEASLAGYYITGHTNADGGRIALTAEADASTIYYFDGTNLIAYQSGLVVGLSSDHWTFATIEDNSKPASTIVFAQSPRTAGAYTVKSADRYFHYTVYNNTVQVNRCADDVCKEHDWYLSEVTELPVTISAAEWASFYAPVAVTLPEGVKAYYAASINEKDQVQMTEIEGTIPANTGVMLNGGAASYNFVIAESAAAIEGENMFKGTVATTQIAEENTTYYLLSMQNGVVGLYPHGGEGAGNFQNNSHKAYLPVTTTEAALSYGFTFGGTTAIEGVEAVAGEQAIYDLTGRKIEAITVPGLYIINGVKTIVE